MKSWLRKSLTSLLTIALLAPMAGAGAAAAPPLVPVRAVAEAAGARVEWDGQARAVKITRGDVSLLLRIGESSATLNGAAVPTGAPITLEKDRTMAPPDFLNAVLGIQATWDGATGKVTVDAMATRAMDFVRALVKGRPESLLFSPALWGVMPPIRLNAISAQLQQLGPISKMIFVGHERTAVHDNVQFIAVFAMAAFDVTIRFDQSGKVDDYFMNTYAGPTQVAGAPPYADSKAFTETEVVVGSGMPFPLPGTLSMPVGQGPFPAVLLVHGSGPNDRDESVGGAKVFRDLAQGLASRGIAVLRYEKRTREHSQKSVTPTFTLQEETVADALAAVALLRGTERIDPRRVFVLGHSQGGYAVPRMIQQDTDKHIAGAILAAGPNSFLDTILEQNKLMVDAKLLPEQQWPFIQGQIAMLRDPKFDPANPPQGFLLGMPGYYLDLRPSAAELAKQQSAPLLVLQGARDTQVPVTQFESWKKDLASRENVTFKLFEKLNHLFVEGEAPLGFVTEYAKPVNVPSYVIDEIAGWIGHH